MVTGAGGDVENVGLPAVVPPAPPTVFHAGVARDALRSVTACGDRCAGRHRRWTARSSSVALSTVRWAAEDGWQERVRAWDAELDARRREEFAAATVDASRQQAETAARIRLGVDAFARSFLDELARCRERGEDPFADLTPSQKFAKLGGAARALQHAQQVERLARGLSTDSIDGGAVAIPPHIERMSEQELVEWLTGRRSGAGNGHSAN
jgi:hypothetical protein